MFPMPRVVYAMASEGLIFKFFDYVQPRLKTPLYACIFTGLFSAIMSCFFDLNQLIDMLSIGTLLAYTLVSACVISLRYRPTDSDKKTPITNWQNVPRHPLVLEAYYSRTMNLKSILQLLFTPEKKCNFKSSILVNVLTVIIGTWIFKFN